MGPEACVVLCTVDSKELARRIGENLLREGLAGCIQMLPIESVYVWEGKIESGEEFLCIIKSEKRLFKELKRRIEEEHPYQVPEILCMNVEDGSESYLQWLSSVLKK